MSLSKTVFVDDALYTTFSKDNYDVNDSCYNNSENIEIESKVESDADIMADDNNVDNANLKSTPRTQTSTMAALSSFLDHHKHVINSFAVKIKHVRLVSLFAYLWVM